MKRIFTGWILLAAFLAACGGAEAEPPTPSPTEPPPATATPPPTATQPPAATDTATPEPPTPAAEPPTATEPAATGSVVRVGTSSLGAILTDGQGMSLYVFLNDPPNRSTCTGGCSNFWPPFLTDGPPVAGSGVDAALLGVIDRGDGTMQVTYNSRPLYFYDPDQAPGDTRGQGVSGVWFVVSPAGEPIQ